MSCEVFNETDFGMIEGSQQILNVSLYNVFGESYSNIIISKIEWRLSKYGETECLVSKSSESELSDIQYDKNIIDIVLTENDTIGLYGKFTHQLIIEDYKKKIFIVDLGKISIKPQIK